MQQARVSIQGGRAGYAGIAVGCALALLAFLTWFQFVWSTFWPAATRDEWRRPALWVAARLAVEGEGTLIYSPQSFRDASIRLGAIPDIFETNAPTALIPYLPIAELSVGVARTLWIFFSLAAFVVAWALLLYALRLPILVALALSSIVPLFQPWRYGIYTGQVYSSMLLFTVAGALLALRADQPGAERSEQRGTGIMGGLAFGLAAITRHYYGLLFLVPALIKRQWAVVAASLAVFGAGVAFTLALVGGDAWGTSLHLAWTWRERPETAVTAYQSVNNFLTHLFRADPSWNPAPAVDATGIVGPLWWLTTLIILGVSGLALRRSGLSGSGVTVAQKLLPYALAIPVALLVSPISEDYHYTLTLFPLVVAFTVLFQAAQKNPLFINRKFNISRAHAGLVVLAISAVFLGAPWQYYNVPVGAGWVALFYYPRLYGNLMLWGLLVVLLWRSVNLQPDSAE